MKPRHAILVLFLASSVLSACATPPAQDPSGTQVPKDVFLNLMQGQSAQILCKTEKYRSCLELSKERCESEVTAVAPKCTEQLMKTMPDFVASKEDGRRFGEEYGKCLIIRQLAYGKHDLAKINKCNKLK